MNKAQAAKILNVDVNDTPENIKRQYKRKAKQYHPDAGGKKGDFERVRIAYETLNETEQKRPSNAVQEFVQSFHNALSRNNPTTTDLISATIKDLETKYSGQAQQLSANTKALNNCDEVLKRLKCKRQENPIATIMLQTKNQIIADNHRMKLAMEDIKEAMDIASEYSYENESQAAAPNPITNWYFQTTGV